MTIADDLRVLAQGVDGLLQERDFLQTQLTVARADGEACAADLAETLAALHDCRNPARGLLGWNREDARFKARRLYYRPANATAMLAEVQAVVDAGQRPLVSLKSGLPLADLPSLPPCDFAWHHEPEDDFTDAAVFRTGFDAAAALLPAGVRPVVCLMGWTFDSRSGRDPADWLPATAQALAVDPYNWFGVTTQTWVSPAEMLAAPLEFARSRDLPLLIWETNCAEDPADPNRKAGWLRELFDFVEAERIEHLVFFDAVSKPGVGKFVLFSSVQAAAVVEEAFTRPYFGG